MCATGKRFSIVVVALLISAIGVFGDDDHKLLDGYRRHYIEAGIVTEYEASMFFLSEQYAQDNIDLLNWRALQFDIDCPPLSDRFKFPPYRVTHMNWRVACDYENYLQNLAPFLAPQQQEQLLPVYQEQQRRRLLWDLINDIAIENPYGDGVRLNLQRVREMVGREVYAKGEIPLPLVPQGYYTDWRRK